MMTGMAADRHAGLCLMISAAALIAGLVVGCERDTPIAKLASAPENEPDQTFLDSRIVVTETGITSAIVAAESIGVYTDTGFTAVEGGVTIEFFDSGGAQTSTLTADRGEGWGLYDEVDSLIACGNVTVISTDGTKKMETGSSFTWKAGTRRVYADGLVRLITGDAVEEGVNFVANDDLSEYSMDDVSGEYGGGGFSLPDR